MNDHTNPASRLLTQKEVAERLHIAERTLERWRVTGDGPVFLRIGPRRLAFRESDVEAWLNQNSFKHRADELARVA